MSTSAYSWGEFFNDATVGVNALSAFACLYLLFRYIKSKERAMIKQMVIILNCADFLFHAITLIPDASVYVTLGAIKFSVLWTCNIAFMTYRIASRRSPRRQNYYVLASFFLILLISVGFAVM